MDPVTLITTALITGAVASLQDTATQAIKDAYGGLKALIQKRFEGNAKASMTLAEHEKDPKTWEQPMEQAIKETRLDQDEEILRLAQELLKLQEAGTRAAPKYMMTMENVQGVVQGENATVTMNFSESVPNKKKEE